MAQIPQQRLKFASDDNSGSSNFVLGRYCGTLVSSSARTGALEFKTANAGNESTQMYISPTGDIGIGNKFSPSSKLDVTGALKASSAELTGTLTASTIDVGSMDLSGTLTAATDLILNAGNIDGVALGVSHSISLRSLQTLSS